MKYLSLILVFIFAQSAWSCPPLTGKWKSSLHMSMEYNKKHAELEPRQMEFLNQILGHMEISYTENQIHEHELPTLKVISDAREHDFVFEDLKYSYNLISCSDQTIKLSFTHPYTGEEEIELTFLNDDIYWVSPEMMMPRSREYFYRIGNDT